MKTIFMGILLIVGTLSNGCTPKLTCKSYSKDYGRELIFNRQIQYLSKYGKVINRDQYLEILIPYRSLFLKNSANLNSKAKKIINNLVGISRHFSQHFITLQGCQEGVIWEQSLVKARVRELGKKLREVGVEDNLIIMGINPNFCSSTDKNFIAIIFKKGFKDPHCPGGDNYCYSGKETLICR